MWENTDQKKLHIWRLFTQWYLLLVAIGLLQLLKMNGLTADFKETLEAKVFQARLRLIRKILVSFASSWHCGLDSNMSGLMNCVSESRGLHKCIPGKYKDICITFARRRTTCCICVTSWLGMKAFSMSVDNVVATL